MAHAAAEARGERVGRTLGSDGDSPSAYSALCQIRRGLMWTPMRFRPSFRVETWKGHVYAACWWHPVGAPLAVLRPERWHTTVLRAWTERDLGEIQPYFLSWQTLLQGLMEAILWERAAGDGTVKVWMVAPPWAGSWTFGVPREVEGVLGPLQTALAALIISMDGKARVTPEADAHISWN